MIPQKPYEMIHNVSIFAKAPILWFTDTESLPFAMVLSHAHTRSVCESNKFAHFFSNCNEKNENRYLFLCCEHREGFSDVKRAKMESLRNKGYLWYNRTLFTFKSLAYETIKCHQQLRIDGLGATIQMFA